MNNGLIIRLIAGEYKVYDLDNHNIINCKPRGVMRIKSSAPKVGDYVDQNTQIGVMGGNPSVTYWDKCTTGTHLHFSVARGLYLKDYSS